MVGKIMKNFTSRSALKFSALVLSAGLAVTLNGCDSLTGGGDAKQNAGAGMHRMPQVGIQKAEPTQVPNTLSFTGRAVPFTIAEVRPQVDGIITERLFEEGQHVAKGDILYKIDDETYQALYDNAQAEIKKSQALLTNAELKVKRNQRLVKINAVSEQVLDDAMATLREAKANLEANKAALKTASINLERTKIKAPVSGMIGRSSFTKGALVMNNQAEVMATIQQLDPIYVDFSVPSYYAAILKRAMKKNPDMNIEKFPVTITFDNGEKYEHTGHIKLSEFSVDESTDTIILRTEFDNPDTQLLPGMFIRGSVMTGYHKDVYLVPSLSLSRDTLGHAFVMVLAQDGTVTVRPVKEKGLYKESWVITDGLQPGDQVIVKGLQFIRPGMKAAVMGAKPAAAPSATKAPENAKEGK
ncbi:efflux transporter periplasmic adaptor subunit [Thiomicrospira sp. S5]|nr:efflux transporter periplasmic adaptor subunit [Thiomicrospira sp. S5]